MINHQFGIASKYRECFDGIPCTCGWGNVSSKGIETCQDKPQNCVFWSEDAQDLRDASITHQEYQRGKKLKSFNEYKEERLFGENIREAIQILKRWLKKENNHELA